MQLDIERYVRNKQVWEVKTIPAGDIPFSQAVADACKQNACGRYGSCWTCPPGVGEWQELEKKIKAYDKATVFTCKYELEDCFDYESMTEGNHKTATILREIITELKSDKFSFLALGCEGCTICDKCTYPDAPCRYPEKSVPSVEACGIDVVTLAKNIGIRYNNGANTVTYFCMILSL